jgi:hypothetical protein
MGRPHLRVVTACTALAAAAPAPAADITRVVTAAEPNNAFNLDFSVRWDRVQKRVRITREEPVAATAAQPYGAIEELVALRYTRVTNAIVPRIAVGLYQDLELHIEAPYVLNDDASWRAGLDHGFETTTIADNVFTPSGGYCDPANPATTCPIFAVPNTVYHGGKLGDVKAGVAWGVFNDRKDDTKPYWLVGVDITFPSAELYDPVAGRNLSGSGQPWMSPYSVAAKPGPFGEKVWKFDLYTALSKRMGVMDPYFKAHVVSVTKTASTFSNCDHAAAMATRIPAEAGSWAPANCNDAAGARPPYMAGIVLGTEVVPYEDTAQGQKVSLDLRLTADYTSSARWYNELTDATGKILWTDPFVTVGALFGLYLRASDYVAVSATASLATETPHFLTGEQPGGSISTPGPNLNPNYDFRLDAPGHRFRATETSIFAVNLTGILRF